MKRKYILLRHAGPQAPEGFLTEQKAVDDILCAMNAADMSQRELAKRLGVSEARVSRMLRDGSNMGLRTVERIWTVLAACRRAGSDAANSAPNHRIALAAATGTAKTRNAAECGASQSGGSASERNAQPSSGDTSNE